MMMGQSASPGALTSEWVAESKTVIAWDTKEVFPNPSNETQLAVPVAKLRFLS